MDVFCPTCGYDKRLGRRVPELARNQPDVSQIVLPPQLAAATPEPSNPFRARNSLEQFAINNGVVGGIAAMTIAVVWFVVGLKFGWIYFYPPVLFVIGAIAFFKGLLGGT